MEPKRNCKVSIEGTLCIMGFYVKAHYCKKQSGIINALKTRSGLQI